MNDALAEAMTAAGYQKVDRALAPVRSTTKLIRENGQLRKRIVELEATNQRLVSELAAARSDVTVSPIRLRTILREVAEKHQISVMAIQSERRHRSLVLARHEYCWRAVNETPKSLPEIGRSINRDHTTVMHGRDKHQARLDAGEVAS